jgi:NUDIX domain
MIPQVRVTTDFFVDRSEAERPPRNVLAGGFTGKAVEQSAQAVPTGGDPLREGGRQLLGDDDTGFNDVVVVTTGHTCDSKEKEVFMVRLPYQILVYICRRPTPHITEYLLLKRSAARGGFWQGVTGGVEVGETLAQAARREVWEETGYQQFTRFMPLDVQQGLTLLTWPENQETLSRFADTH